MFRPLALVAAFCVAACNPTIQTTSGAEYLSRGPVADAAIREAAAIEPDLTFPARIGIARIVNGTLTQAPPREAQELAGFVERHAAMGEWVALSPLVASWNRQTRRNASLPDRLRVMAARQHLDYLLVYELGARAGEVGNTPFALADITLIGGLVLPTRTTRATGVGAALFVDVRNGYPYGTVSTTKDLQGLARSWHGNSATRRLQERATLDVAQDLLPKVDEMLTLLRDAAD